MDFEVWLMFEDALDEHPIWRDYIRDLWRTTRNLLHVRIPHDGTKLIYNCDKSCRWSLRNAQITQSNSDEYRLCPCSFFINRHHFDSLVSSELLRITRASFVCFAIFFRRLTDYNINTLSRYDYRKIMLMFRFTGTFVREFLIILSREFYVTCYSS